MRDKIKPPSGDIIITEKCARDTLFMLAAESTSFHNDKVCWVEFIAQKVSDYDLYFS